jgi:tetratricopeptide (TPR) repeat protein
MTRIYVSSTYSDLVEHRQQVYDILRKMRYDVVAMEDYVATDQRPLDKCLADVASCDVYVGIFAWRYGYVPPGQERSITELEYRQAGQSGLARLIFLLDEDAPWPRSQMEKGAGGEKIEALRAELATEHTVRFFKSPEELAGQVATSISQWAQERLAADMDSLRARRDQADRERREKRERQRVVNLRPLDVAHFKDRLREIQALCDHLADASVRLVSVVGRGGMGKTALVSKVLADLERGVDCRSLPLDLQSSGQAADYKSATSKGGWQIDGILYLSARSTGLDLERIYADVGRMLGEPTASQLAARWAGDAPLAAKVEYLLETMRDGLYLILLDNLEDELEDGAIAEEGLGLFVERCLTQPDGVRLVVTSREEIRLAGAALHGARCIPLREGLPEDEAVALLRDLDPQGALGLRDAPEDDLRRATRLTRGIPRALEILAGILHGDPTASLPKLLADERLFGKKVVERLVKAGYRRLGEDEQRIMEALAVFDRPVDETAVAYLLHPWFPGLDVRAGLRRLVSGYFVSASRVTGEYSLHPLDHDYAYRQLPDDERTGEEYTRRNLELRAADFYAGLRKPEGEWKTIDDLAPQLAEFEHRVHGRDYDGACRVLDQIDFSYLLLWGHYARLIELREKLLGRLTDPRSRTYNLGNLGRTYYSIGQVERSIELFEEALAIAREIDDRAGEGRCLGNLGLVYYDLGQIERSIELFEEALTIAREIGDRWNEGAQLSRLGMAYRNLGQLERTIEFYEQALAILREIGDHRYEGGCLSGLGLAYRALGQLDRAIKFFEEALAIAREIGDRWSEGAQLGRLGMAYRNLGQLERAIKLFEEALAIAREIGYRQRESVWLSNLGSAYYALGQLERAIKLFEEALIITREIHDRRVESYQLLGLGRALLDAGLPQEARQHCAEALSLGLPEIDYWAALALGIVLSRQGNPAAGDTFADAITRCRAMLDKTADLYEPRYALATALVGSAVCDPRWAEEGQQAELLAPALAEYRRALENCAVPGVVRDAVRDLEMIRAAGIEGLEPVFELLQSEA